MLVAAARQDRDLRIHGELLEEPVHQRALSCSGVAAHVHDDRLPGSGCLVGLLQRRQLAVTADKRDLVRAMVFTRPFRGGGRAVEPPQQVSLRRSIRRIASEQVDAERVQVGGDAVDPVRRR
jgi:hypothetical protein